MHSFSIAKIREVVSFAQTDGKIKLWAKLYKNTKFKGPGIKMRDFYVILTFFLNSRSTTVWKLMRCITYSRNFRGVIVDLNYICHNLYKTQVAF